MRNALIAFAIILLAVLSAPRLALDFAPRPPSSQLIASIRFPAAASSDPVDMTTRYVLPLETAIRSLGDVVATRGDVGADGVSMTVRFRRGVDAELKAARLVSELAPLRARLPEGSDVAVWPAGDRGDDESAIVALTEKDAGRVAERVADELRATPGVREVTTFGAAQEEVDVRTFGDAPADFARVIARALTPRILGKRVLAAPTATRLRDARVNGTRLESMATIRERQAEPRLAARLDGREAVLLAIVRDDDVPLFDFDRAIRRTLAGRNVTFISSDAAELRALLVRVGIGALLAMLVLAFVDWRLAFYIPLAFAIVINICRIASLRVDASSLLAACIAIAAMSAFSVRRPGFSPALFATLPLIAVALASNVLAATLVLPARMFAIAAISALAASMLTTRQSPIANRQSQGKLERRLLRASASIVLAAVAASTFLLSWWGDRLDPRQPVRSTQRSRLFIHLALPAGTPLTPTLAALQDVERGVRGVEGISRFWSFAQPGRATVIAEVAPASQRPDAFELLQLRLRAAMPLASGAVTVDEERSTGGGSTFDGGLEEKTFADEKSNRYRVLLKGTDAEAMRRALESLIVRLGSQGIRRDAIRPGWPEASTQVTLVPRPGIAPAMATQLAQSLADLTLPPRRRLLPDGRTLVAASADAPRHDDDVPRAADLFARPLPMTIDAAFDVRREPVSGRITRELGRFVLPIDIAISGYELEQRKQSRANVDRSLSLMQFPAGIVLERPSLAQWDFSAVRLRLFGLAALLPSLLFALAAVVLSSLRRALIALTPALLGVAATAPVLAAINAPMDELALLAIGAAVSIVTALATIALLRFTNIAATYRTLRATFVPCTVATLAGAVLLLVAGTGGRELGDVWRVPLFAACVVVFVGGTSALILPAALLSLRVRRRVVAHFPDAGTISVQNLTKVYAGGFRALHRVSFELEPGVIGLLGPNGAGKTTLLRILTGLLLPTRGVVRFGGVDVKPETLAEYRRRIGFLPQEFNAYAGLTAAQFLDYWALERGIGDTRARRDEVDRLLAIARLEAHAGRKLRDFSGGMRQRIGIARAMIGNPPLLVVDEPTTGLDIEARGHFRDLITSLARDRIIILSTHIASDVEATAGRLLLLSRGRLVWDGAPEALLARARGRVFETIVDDAEARELTRLHRITTRVRLASGVRLRGIVADGEPLPGASVDATLEEAYLAEIAGNALRSSGSFAFVYEG